MFQKFTAEQRVEYRKKKQEQASEQLKKITYLFATQTFPKMLSKTYLENANKPSNKWSFGNQLLMMISGTTDARGYRQWEQVGRYVKKGSTAIYILGPIVIKKTEKDEKTDKETTHSAMIGVKCIPVFRLEDTDGKSVEIVAPKNPPPLIKVAQKWGCKVVYGESFHGEYGSLNTKTDEIKLCTESPDTFFHELIHEGQKKLDGELKPGQNPEQEIIAQLGACVLSEIYGYDVKSYSWNYIACYSKTRSPEVVGKMCLRVLTKVQKILTIILDEAELVESTTIA